MLNSRNFFVLIAIADLLLCWLTDLRINFVSFLYIPHEGMQ